MLEEWLKVLALALITRALVWLNQKIEKRKKS
jgi:hypothetical protein